MGTGIEERINRAVKDCLYSLRKRRPKKDLAFASSHLVMVLENEKLLINVPMPAPPGWLEKARARFPGLEIVWEEAKLSTMGTKGIDDLPADVVAGVTIMCPSPLVLPSPESMRDVRFVQLVSAGSDRWADHAVFNDGKTVFASGSGVHA